MDAALTQSALSATRSLLIVAGSVLITKGWISSESLNDVVGAVLIIVPLLWGMWQKFQAEKKAREMEALALNIGIVVADNTIGPTPAVPAAKVPEVIQQNEDSVLMPLNPEVQPLAVSNLLGVPK